MKLYIQVQNGEPINHPAFEDNLVQVFNEIPTDWEEFVRLDRPTLSAYEVMVSELPTYSKVDGIWTDVWSIRNMTAEEIVVKQQEVKEAWAALEQAENWSAWTFDAATNKYVPPIPRPEVDQTKIDAGILTMWCGAEGKWKDAPSRPFDDSQYKFDFIAWDWVAI